MAEEGGGGRNAIDGLGRGWSTDNDSGARGCRHHNKDTRIGSDN